MLPYWLLFLFFVAGVLLGGPAVRQRAAQPVGLAIGAFIVVVMVGLRYEVGADWSVYRALFWFSGHAPFADVMTDNEPAYQFLNWTVQRLGGGIWAVNLVSALIFTWGLSRFSRSQKEPWLSWVVAIPYLVIVVAMGYTRQSIAIGILMAGLAAYFGNRSMLRFVVYVAFAALFHRTAVVVFLLVALSAERTRFLNLLSVAVVGLLLYDTFLSSAVERFRYVYIEQEYASQGAGIRVAMNVVAAILFLAYSKRLAFSETEHKIWRNFSLAALALVPVLYLSPSSTAVDRIALYLIPLQLAVLARAPGTLVQRGLGVAAVVGYSAAVQFTWMNYAVHAEHWVPYRSFLL